MATDYCTRCRSVMPSHRVRHAGGTEFVCAVCGAQTDFLHDEEEEEDANDVIGCCETCGANIYVAGQCIDFCEGCYPYSRIAKELGDDYGLF